MHFTAIMMAWLMVFFPSCKSTGRSILSRNEQPVAIVDGNIQGGTRTPEAGAPNLTIGNTIFFDAKITMMVMLKAGDSDLFIYQIIKPNGDVVKRATTPLDTVFFWDIPSGTYQVSAAGCQRDRLNVQRLACSEYSPQQTFAFINELSPTQKQVFKAIDAANKETALITLQAHAKIIEFLKDAEYPDVQKNPDLQNAFNLAMLGPDQIARLLSDPQVIGLAQNLFVTNLQPTNNGSNGSNPPPSKNEIIRIGNTAVTIPTILISVGSILFLASAIALSLATMFDWGTQWGKSKLIQASDKVAENKHADFDDRIDELASNAKGKIDQGITFVEDAIYGRGELQMNEDIWQRINAQYSNPDPSTHRPIAEETSNHIRAEAEKLFGSDVQASEDVIKKQTAFIETMGNGTKFPTGEGPSGPLDAKRFRSDAGYRKSVIDTLATNLTREIAKPQNTAKALEQGDPILEQIVARDRIQTNFLAYQMRANQLESAIYREYLMITGAINGMTTRGSMYQRSIQHTTEAIAKEETLLRNIIATRDALRVGFAVRDNAVLVTALTEVIKKYERQLDAARSEQLLGDQTADLREQAFRNKKALLERLAEDRTVTPENLREWQSVLTEHEGMTQLHQEELRRSLASTRAKLETFEVTVKGKYAKDKAYRDSLREKMPAGTTEEQIKNRVAQYDAQYAQLSAASDNVKRVYFSPMGRGKIEKAAADLMDVVKRSLGNSVTGTIAGLSDIINDTAARRLGEVGATLRYGIADRALAGTTEPMADLVRRLNLGVQASPAWSIRAIAPLSGNAERFVRDNWSNLMEPVRNVIDLKLKEVAGQIQDISVVDDPRMLANTIRETIEEVVDREFDRVKFIVNFEIVARHPEIQSELVNKWIKRPKNTLIEQAAEGTKAGEKEISKWASRAEWSLAGIAVASFAMIAAGAAISSQTSLAENAAPFAKDIQSGTLNYLNMRLIRNIIIKKDLYENLSAKSEGSL